MPSSPGPRPRFAAALPTALAVILLLFAARWFIRRWEEVTGGGDRPEIAWAWLALAAVLLVLHASTALVIWRSVTQAVGARFTWRAAADGFVPSLLARYVPGKIWGNTVRVAIGRKAGVPWGSMSGAILWETLIALASAGIVAWAGLGWYGAAESSYSAAILVALCAAGWMVARLVVRHPRGALFLARFGSKDPLRSPKLLATPFAVSFGGWMVYGLAHAAIVRALAPMTLPDLPLVAGAVALAWAGGYLAIVTPVGLGVRDGILLLLLAPILSPAQALLFVALSRLVQLLVDALVTATWLVARAGRRWPAASTAPPSA